MNKILTAIKKYRTEAKLLITYEEIAQIPLQEIIDMDPTDPGAILLTKIHHDDFSQSLRVEMKADNYWSTHYHDCIETIIIYKGTLFNHTNGGTIDRNNPALFKKYEPHLVEATSDCIFYVEFINPELTSNERIFTK